MTPTDELLLACVAGSDLRRFASEPLDWPRFLVLAERHGMVALANGTLEAAGLRVPPEAARFLWTRSVERERTNRVLSRELARVVQALEGNGLACIPFKGPTLAMLAYGDAHAREFGDLDILVRRGDVAAARGVLQELGYRPEYVIPQHAERSLLAAHKHYDVVLRGTAGNLVELHWRTDPDFPVERDDDEWWASRPRRDLAGCPMRSFIPTELMLVLLLHGSKHYWSSLHWLADVAALSRREAIDWDWIVQRAGALHCRRRVALGAILMRDLLGIAVPASACGDEPRIAAFAACIAREAFEPERAMAAATLLKRNLVLFDRPSHRIRHAVESVFAPTFADWTRWRLPAALAFLYFPLRLARLAGKYGLAPFNRLRPHSRIAATLRTPPPRPHSRG